MIPCLEDLDVWAGARLPVGGGAADVVCGAKHARQDAAARRERRRPRGEGRATPRAVRDPSPDRMDAR